MVVGGLGIGSKEYLSWERASLALAVSEDALWLRSPLLYPLPSLSLPSSILLNHEHALKTRTDKQRDRTYVAIDIYIEADLRLELPRLGDRRRRVR